MRLACAFLLASASALGQTPATITGRVFDSFHRPVPKARVAPMERRIEDGKLRLVAGYPQAFVDDAGMYRLSLPPGKYTLAVTPPPQPLDFAAVFPAYLGDIVDAEKAPAIEVRPAELRPFVDFLLLEVESHRITGRVTGIPKRWGGAAVDLCLVSGYTDPLRTVLTDAKGRFELDHVPAGSYKLEAFGPVAAVEGVVLSLGEKSASIQINVRAAETGGIQIHLHARAR